MLCPYLKVRLNPITRKNITTSCGKCLVCRINYRLPWEYRLYQELKKNNFVGSFVTATYSDDKYNVNYGLNYQHIKTFFDELRKDGLQFKYFTVGEYGEQSARCHWHHLLFGIPITAKKILFNRWKKWCYEPQFVVTPITVSRIRYCLKYMDKEQVSVKDWEDNCKTNQFEFLLDSCKLGYNEFGFSRPRSYCSKGIGKDNFLNRFEDLYENGLFREGSFFAKPSKYYIDCLSRSDIFFQCQRDKFLDNNIEYQNNLNFYKSDYKLKVAMQNQSFNKIKELNIASKHDLSNFYNTVSSDIKPSFDVLTFNYDEDFKREYKRLSCSNLHKTVIQELAQLASKNI